MMSSRSHCAVDITAKFIDVATKQHGGKRSALIRSGWQMLCGARHIRSHELAFALEPLLVRARQVADRPVAPSLVDEVAYLVVSSKLAFARLSLKPTRGHQNRGVDQPPGRACFSSVAASLLGLRPTAG